MIIIIIWEFFTSVFADGLSLEFEQASFGLQNSSQVSSRSQ